MASGINKIPQPGTCNGSKADHCSSAEECNQEIHMKMCKKIAQLTKVIYALNTKNDEHEASIQALKEAHQEEMQSILTETSETILQYKSKAGEEQELRKHIQTLEDTLEQYKRLKEEALAEVTMCRKQVQGRELMTETNHADRIISLSKEMLHMEPGFEDQLQHLNQESDSLINECRACRTNGLGKKEKQSENQSVEFQAIMNEMENLKCENRKLVEEYAQKASRFQVSYEKEKETLKKAMQQSVADVCRQWQQRETEQRKQSEAQEAALQQQVKKLEAELEAKHQKINELKKHSQKLKERLQDLEKQLKETQQENAESKNAVKKLEEELTIAKERLLLQENEILSKTEEMELALNSQCKAMSEVGELKNQMTQLQQVSSTKQSQSKKGTEDSQLLKQPMDPAAVENENRKQHKEELCKIKRQSEEEKKHLKEQLVKGLEDLVKKHTTEIKAVQASMDAERKKLQKEVQIQVEEFKKKSEKEIKRLEEEKETLNGKLHGCSLEVHHPAIKRTLHFSSQLKANTFRESLKEQTLQSSKEREKLLQDLQETIKQNQTVKAQLEASHQRALTLLEKSKNQELKEAEEHLKMQYNDHFKVQQQSHRLEVETLEEKARQELQGELEQLQKQHAVLLDSLRMELSEQRASCSCHKKEMEELQEELKNMRALKKQQASFQFLPHRHTVLLIRWYKFNFRLLEEELKAKHKKELDMLKQDHRKEIQNMVSDFSSAQTHLQAKIVSLETELKEVEEKPRKRESRPEDLHLIGCLQDKLSEREEIIKQLTDGRKFQHSLLPSAESHRNRSFSFNPNPGFLTPTAKKKKMDDAPSRVVSVPNLASYAKSFLSCDLRSKRNAPQITKSTSLEQNPSCIKACYPLVQASDSKPAPR
uniref:Family with sequence similarity 184 member B n=1 Tax=Sphenodon punctatus TaxID=8508 RepID=A0A8D0GMG7_SPHPU